MAPRQLKFIYYMHVCAHAREDDREFQD